LYATAGKRLQAQEVLTMTENSDDGADVVPPPHPELKRLEPLVGTWRSEAHTRDSMLGPGVPVTSTETFSWLDGGYFLVSTYETAFGNEAVQRGVNYWGYDADTNTFRIIFFSNNGPFTEEGNRYEGKVAGRKLIFEGPACFQYDLEDEGNIRGNADGTISVAWWLRDENGDWQPWMNNTFVRVGDGPERARRWLGAPVPRSDLLTPPSANAEQGWTGRPSSPASG
jgi:hypothetical protein